MTDYYGTIMLGDKGKTEKVLGFPIKLDQISGSIVVYRNNTLIEFVVELKSSEDIVYKCDYSGEDYRFLSFLSLSDTKCILDNRDASLSVSGNETIHFSLSFAELRDPKSPLKLRLFTSEKMIFTKEFSLKR
jgi:hypothetical protein